MSIQETTTTTITITWLPPIASIGNSIASYILIFTDELTGSTSNHTAVSTTYTFSGLEEYHNYSCQVKAVSRYGPISVLTAVVIATTLEGGRDNINLHFLEQYSHGIFVTFFTHLSMFIIMQIFVAIKGLRLTILLASHW